MTGEHPTPPEQAINFEVFIEHINRTDSRDELISSILPFLRVGENQKKMVSDLAMKITDGVGFAEEDLDLLEQLMDIGDPNSNTRLFNIFMEKMREFAARRNSCADFIKYVVKRKESDIQNDVRISPERKDEEVKKREEYIINSINKFYSAVISPREPMSAAIEFVRTQTPVALDWLRQRTPILRNGRRMTPDGAPQKLPNDFIELRQLLGVPLFKDFIYICLKDAQGPDEIIKLIKFLADVVVPSSGNNLALSLDMARHMIARLQKINPEIAAVRAEIREALAV